MLNHPYHRRRASEPVTRYTIWCLGIGLVLSALAACSAPDPAALRADAIRRGDAFAEQNDYVQAIRAYREAVALDPRDGATRLKLSRSLRSAGWWSEGAQEGLVAADLLPDDFDAQVWGVEMLLNESRFVDANDRISALMAKHPRHPELFTLLGNTKAKLINSTWGLWRIDELLRKGEDFDRARVGVRPDVPASADNEAEAAYRRAIELAPDSTDAKLALASFLWTVGRPEDSEPLLRQITEAHPFHLLAHSALGRSYLRRGRPAEAEPYLRQAAETLGDRDARIALAEACAALGRLTEALGMFNALAADNEPGGAAALRASDIERKLGDNGAARTRLEALLSRESKNPGALVRHAELLLEAGEIGRALESARSASEIDAASARAREIFGRALSETGNVSGAFEQMTEAARLDPNAVSVSRELAGLALTLGRNDVALEFARKAIRQAPGERTTHVDLVRALTRTGDLEAAARELSPLLSREPNSPELLVLSGDIHAARRQPAPARLAYTRALDLAPDSFDALSSLVALDIRDGRAREARSRIDNALRTHSAEARYLLLSAQVAVAESNTARAETLLRRALDADPAHAPATLLLARLLMERQQLDDARQTLERGLQHRRSSLNLQVMLARVLEGLGRTADARARYEATLIEHPDDPQAAYRLAALHIKEGGNLDVALTLATNAKRRLPNDPEINATLGWLHVQRNFPSMGLPYLQEAVGDEPNNALFRYYLGRAFLGARQLQRGREELTRALQLDPDFAHANEARATLASLGR